MNIFNLNKKLSPIQTSRRIHFITGTYSYIVWMGKKHTHTLKGNGEKGKQLYSIYRTHTNTKRKGIDATTMTVAKNRWFYICGEHIKLNWTQPMLHWLNERHTVIQSFALHWPNKRFGDTLCRIFHNIHYICIHFY